MKRIVSETLKIEKLFESPDEINYMGKIYDVDKSTQPFDVISDDFNEIVDVLVYNKGTYHDRNTFELEGGFKKIYPGRLFFTPKVLTFWGYPTPEELSIIVSILEDKINDKIFDNDWKIEIYEEGLEHIGNFSYDNTYDRKDYGKIIPIEKYLGSSKPSEEKYLQHLDAKTKHQVPPGYGSKNPDYINKRRWQIASSTDESEDNNFYPKLFEESKKSKKSTYLADEKKLPKNVKERTDVEFGKKPNANQEKLINKTKEYYTSLPDKTQVFYVDIKPVRDIDYGDFVEGGNEMAYPNFVPMGEIWIDKIFKGNKKRTEQIIVHEAIERKEMQNDANRPYFKETAKTRTNKTGEEGAHVDANRVEKKFRDGKISFKDAINKFYKIK